MDYHDLTIEEKIGQMIMIGMDTNYITDRIKTMITKYKIGGILLYRKNFNTYEDMLKLINDLKNLNKNNKIPLFIAIDQEGGRVNRFPPEIKNLPAANKLASLNNLDTVMEATKITSELLSSSGFNLNFAPVLDIKRFNNSHPIGDRCYSDNKDDVTKYTIPVMKEFQKNDIVSVIKHFPGHGATKLDSHFLLPIINSNIKTLEKDDWYPFLYAFKNGADALLLSHIVIRNITGIYPASLSRKFIVEYIRRKYKYNGLIITDDLKMRSIRFIYGPVLAVEKAFKAGNDIILFRFNERDEKKALNRIYSLVKHKSIKESRINRSVNRVIKIKEKYKCSDIMPDKKVNIEEINDRINKIRKEAGLP